MAAGSDREPAHSSSAVTDEAALLQMTNREIDSLFRSSPDGGVPDGDMRGTALLFPGTWAAKPLAAAIRVIAWQGKVVDRRRGELKNKITPFGLRLIRARVSIAPAWVDDAPCVLLDYSQTSFVARMVRDEIRLVAPDLYVGVVWLWRRRVAWFTLRGLAP